jgi:TIR domain
VGGLEVKVFISHSRKDEAVAHLLAHILRANQIDCLIDRELQAGQKFDSKLQHLIKEANLILVLLTKDASRSPWVNQEIGFAIAHGKTVWPLAIETDIEPYGMFSTTQAYSLFDWSDPAMAIQRLVSALQNSVPEMANPYKQFGFDHVIEGKSERTRFIADRLRELRKDQSRRLVILHQAAFSIFAASDDRLYREAGGHSPEYMELLLEERKALDELVSMPNCSYKVILWPVRAYEDRYLAIRYANLLVWMEKVRDDPTVEYVCAQYPGPNRLIVMGEFLADGFKLHHHPGYEMTVVKYQEEQIEEAAAVFHQTFGRPVNGKETARERIRQMYEKVSNLSVGSGS